VVSVVSLNDWVDIDDAAAGGNNDGAGAQNNDQVSAALRQDNALVRQDLTETRAELRGLWTRVANGGGACFGQQKPLEHWPEASGPCCSSQPAS
jgi:hypothetical protein